MRSLIVILIVLLLAVPAFAQEATPEPEPPAIVVDQPIADLSVENILLIAFAAVTIIIAVFGAVMRPVLVNAMKQAPDIAKVSFEAGYLEAERRLEQLVKSTKTPVDDALADQVRGYIREILLEAGVLKPPAEQ